MRRLVIMIIQFTLTMMINYVQCLDIVLRKV